MSQMGNVEQLATETDCLPGYIAKGIAIACFYYARCLHLGLGIKKDGEEAKKYYSKVNIRGGMSQKNLPQFLAYAHNCATHMF